VALPPPYPCSRYGKAVFQIRTPFANNLHNGITAGLPGSLERFTASPKSLKFSFQSFSTKSGQLVGLVTRRSTVVLPGQHKTEAKERCAFDYRHPIKDWVFARRRHRGRTPIWGQAILRMYIRPAAHRAGIQKQFGWAHVQAYVLDSPAECRNRIQSRAGTGAAFNSAIHVGRLHPGNHTGQTCSAGAVLSLVFSEGADGTSEPPSDANAAA
jgi:hypothetical protein